MMASKGPPCDDDAAPDVGLGLEERSPVEEARRSAAEGPLVDVD